MNNHSSKIVAGPSLEAQVLRQVDGFNADPARLRHANLCDSTWFDGVEWPLEIGPPPNAGGILAVAWKSPIGPVADTVAQLVSIFRELSSRETTTFNLAAPGIRSSSPGDASFRRYADALNFAYELLTQCRFEADAVGLVVALEVARDGCLLSPVETRDLVDAMASHCIGACLDIDRVSRIGDPLDWISTLGRRLRSVRASTDAGLAAIHQALKSISFEGAVIFAGPASDDLGRAWQALD